MSEALPPTKKTIMAPCVLCNLISANISVKLIVSKISEVLIVITPPCIIL